MCSSTFGPAIGPYNVIPIQSAGGYFLAAGGLADPQSGALPVPLPFFRHLFDTGGGQFFVSGSDPKVVPEPGALLLLGSGLALIGVRRLVAKRAHW